MSSDKTGRTLPRRRSAGREDFLRALLLLPLALPFGAMMHRLHARSRPAPQRCPPTCPWA
jgi:hypothetical protein